MRNLHDSGNVSVPLEVLGRKHRGWSASVTRCEEHQSCFVAVFFPRSVPIPERPVTLGQGEEGSDEGRESCTPPVLQAGDPLTLAQ